jgi:hypothetical protein
MEALAAKYEEFRRHRPPRGFGPIADEVQVLLDLLDGDVSGMAQRRLAGDDIAEDLDAWKRHARDVREKLTAAAAKLKEAEDHAALLFDLGARLED